MDNNRLKKRVNITLEPLLNDRWNAVVKKHNLKKSAMVQEFLEIVIPILENDELQTVIKKALENQYK